MRIAAVAIIVSASISFPGIVSSQECASLSGQQGSSNQWGSAWLELSQAVDLASGEKVQIQLGGEADAVIVRLLLRGQDPGMRVGVLSKPLRVTEDNVVSMPINSEVRSVVQISVHGGPSPWGMDDLGQSNGAALINSVCIVR